MIFVEQKKLIFAYVCVSSFQPPCLIFHKNGDVINQKSAPYLPIERLFLLCYFYAQLEDMVQIFN